MMERTSGVPSKTQHGTAPPESREIKKLAEQFQQSSQQQQSQQQRRQPMATPPPQ
jgi:hypothetical protein